MGSYLIFHVRIGMNVKRNISNFVKERWNGDKMNLIIITNIVEIIKFFIIFSIMLKGKIYRSKRLWIGCLIVFAEVIFFSFCLKNDDFIISIIIFGSALSVMYNGNCKK